MGLAWLGNDAVNVAASTVAGAVVGLGGMAAPRQRPHADCAPRPARQHQSRALATARLPNGVACVASALAAAGHDVRVLDLCFASDPVAAARESVRRVTPGCDWRLGSQHRQQRHDRAPPLHPRGGRLSSARCAPRAPHAPVLAGGAAFGVAPESLFRELGVDYAVAGDGERASVALVDALAAGRSLNPSPDWCAGWETESCSRRRARMRTWTRCHDRALHRWLDVARYERHGATVPIQTKRGCVYKCVYCTYRNVEGWGYRLRDPRAVAGEIAELRREAGVTHFDFVDSTFNSPPGHAIDVCEAIVHAGLRVQLETMNFTPATCSDELLAAMRAAGFRDPRHHGRKRQRSGAGDASRKASTPPGFATSREQRVARRSPDTLDLSDWRARRDAGDDRGNTGVCGRRMRAGDAVYVTVGLRIYPGTTLHRIALAEGAVGYGDSLLAPAFYFAAGLDLAQTVRRLRIFASRAPTIHVLRRRAIPPLATADTLRVASCGCHAPTGAIWRSFSAWRVRQLGRRYSGVQPALGISTDHRHTVAGHRPREAGCGSHHRRRRPGGRRDGVGVGARRASTSSCWTAPDSRATSRVPSI